MLQFVSLGNIARRGRGNFSCTIGNFSRTSFLLRPALATTLFVAGFLLLGLALGTLLGLLAGLLKGAFCTVSKAKLGISVLCRVPWGAYSKKPFSPAEVVHAW